MTWSKRWEAASWELVIDFGVVAVYGKSMEDALNWAKEHKKGFVKRIVDKYGAASEAEPAGIFMAGLPGAGNK